MNTRLFPSPEHAHSEAGRARARERIFEHTAGQLQNEWYEKLVADGMPRDQVYDRPMSGSIARRYSALTEEQFILFRRFRHLPAFRKCCRKGTYGRNCRIWDGYCDGKTQRAIAEEVRVSPSTVSATILCMKRECARLLAKKPDAFAATDRREKQAA